MYSGSLLNPLKGFDAWFGTHQKINRVARAHLAGLYAGRGYTFPGARQINRFEGVNGPDGLKRKAPGQDELRHFYDPQKPSEATITAVIEEHYKQLVTALRDNNQPRASFEAAWLAHALVDGLTPAHHYPYEEELVKLRGGEGIESRDSLKKQILLPGETFTKQVHNNWKMFGDRGLLSTHFAFEMGIAVMISPLRVKLGRPSDEDLVLFRQKGVVETFRAHAHKIAELKMYDAFYKSGWTPKLARQVRRELVPVIVNMVTIAWYGAVAESQKPRATRRKRA